MMPKIRHAISKMENQRISQVVRLGMEDPEVIPLWFGESDLVTPKFIREAAYEALNAGHTFYVNRRGLLPLRQEIQNYLSNLYPIDLDLDRITVTASGMTSIMIAAEFLVNNGDNVVMVSPIWPNIFYVIETMGGECRHVRLDEVDGEWTLDMDKLFDACDERTKAIFVATPGNPTGWMMSRQEQRDLLAFCRERNIWVIADEVYHRIVYEEDISPSFLEIAEEEDPLFVIQSFSKSWAMTGWRLGWLVHPKSIADRVGDLSAINNTGATSFVQHAGVSAIQQGESFIHDMVERCRKGREITYDYFSTMDRVSLSRTPAAFYAFFRVDGLEDDLGFAKELLSTAKVGLAPGSAFGPGNEGYLRLCFAHDTQNLSVALERLGEVL